MMMAGVVGSLVRATVRGGRSSTATGSPGSSSSEGGTSPASPQQEWQAVSAEARQGQHLARQGASDEPGRLASQKNPPADSTMTAAAHQSNLRMFPPPVVPGLKIPPALLKTARR